MSEPARRVITYQDVLDAPDGFTAQILNGELHLSPRPAHTHTFTGSGMIMDVGGQFSRRGTGGPGGWVILYEPELWLGSPDPRSQVVVPDLAGWRADRFTAPDHHGHTLVPDWVCEILSPGAHNIRRDRLIKADIYHVAGVPWFWIVDPIARTVEVHERQERGYLRVKAVSGDADVRLPPFDAVELPMGAWWSGPPDDEDPDAG